MKLSRSNVIAALAVVAATLVVVSCLDDTMQSPVGPSFATSSGPVTLVGAGNIAKCGNINDDATAALLDAIPGTVFALGDAAYDNGTTTQYNTCYGPSWGRHKARTQPAPGDRDYKTAGAAGYFGYFGAAAGDPAKGYYSYDLGAWHVVVLNSGSTAISMAAGSPQEQWLRADLAANPARCTIAYWHHPLFDSKDSPNLKVRPLWDALYAAGVDVVVNAHYAFYERFAPQTPAGVADPASGIREFVVGTGGAESQNPDHLRANSEVRNGTTPGVLKLTLDDGGYAWEFVPIAGKTFQDSGSGTCHGAPLAVNAGPDVTTNPGDTLALSIGFSDTDPAGAPWAYTVLWGDGTSSAGTTQSQTPISAGHAYSALGLRSVRVTVTNNAGSSGADTVAVNVVAPNVLVGAADIGDCTTNKDSLTANLLDTIPGTVFVAGDAAYPNGSTTDFKNCYQPTWGRFKSRTKPAPGNHEYLTAGAKGYFDYFGSAAGPSGKGYYSYNLGDWHIVTLNSNIPMSAGSPQHTWLRADLAANTKQCTLAYWHHPFFSSGTGETHPDAQAAWDALYAAGAEVVIVGHHHHYERFAPQTPGAVPDAVTGIRQFIVGTGGGEGLFGLVPAAANSEVRDNGTFGVLKLTLKAGGYTWKFIPIAGRSFTDAGSGACHGTPPTGTNQAPTAVPGGPYSALEGSTLTFDGTGSSDPDGETLSYAWNFGDGSTGTGAAPSHIYAAAGSYTVALTVTDTRGATSTPATTTATITSVGAFNVLLSAGDISTCNDGRDELTAQILDTIAGTVVTLGDNVFPGGTLSNYMSCYDPTWGRHKARTYATLGNQEYSTGNANGSFDYFGDRAGPRDKGYYSFDVGAWHIIVLNSNRNFVPTSAGSEQDLWLQADLAANTKQCTLATFHQPRFFSSNEAGFTSSTIVTNLWNRLYAAGADVVLNAQEHHYERFAPQTPTGVADSAYGIKEFNVGTGGESVGMPTVIAANSEVRAAAFGVLKLVLYPDRYTWQFVPMQGETFTDAGSGTCHFAPPAGSNGAPTAAPGGPYAGAEGVAVSFDGTGSSDPDGDGLTYAWSFGDGTSGTGSNPTHAYDDNGDYTVSLTVTDIHGAASLPVTTTAGIANTAPVVSAGPDQTFAIGIPVTINATFSDLGLNDAPWAYTIDWGDGSAATAGSTTSQTTPITATHVYSAAGPYTVQVSVTDKDGGAGSGLLTMAVGASVTLVGAGNIARCDRTGDEATAALLDAIPGTVFALGDAALPGGTPTAYANCYDPTWGRHKARTTPAPSHRDYDSSATAAGYFGYWGAQAGDPTGGYYSYDLGAWHIVVLNSTNAFVSTAVGSPQETWLRADLAATTKQCVLALFHNARFFSTTGSTISPTGSVKPFWDDLYAAGAELIVNAHLRDYERFAPQTPAGVADPVNGIRQIIVGTGGDGLDLPNTLIAPNSEVQISGVFGVLKLTLSDGSYVWEFVPVAGQTATDSGSGTCH
ncbi:MAG: PKD domain-containing protein [Acidobacteriota bacterium]